MSEISAQSESVLTLSEVMFYPAETNGEFVEIYNLSFTETVDLSGIKFKYSSASPNSLIPMRGGMLLGPRKFAVILQGNYDLENGLYKPLIPQSALILKTSSNYFGSAGMSNSTGNTVSLVNSSGNIIDAYIYSANNTAGYSDEKISLTKENSSSNWENSLTLHGTPGTFNSLSNIPSYPFHALVVNEIMFDPAEGNSEYIEFYNASEDSVRLIGLQIFAGTSNKFKLASKNLILPPQKYYLLASDSAVFNCYPYLGNPEYAGLVSVSSISLSNEGGNLLLKDYYGNIMDSLYYSPQWHSVNIVTTKNRSLEKINPLFDSGAGTNWNSCADPLGGTPCRPNSIFSKNETRSSSVTVSPNPFSPDGDGFEDYTVINFDLAENFVQVRIKVFDSQGRLVRNFIENRLSASQNSIVYDGLDDAGKPLRIGIYILLIETSSAGSGNASVYKMPLVIARKL